MSRSVLLIAFAMLAIACVVNADAPFQPPEYRVEFANAPPLVDGKLDDACWKNAPVITDFQFPWWKSGKKEQTRVQLVWDKDYLYIACACDDEFITARHTERDSKIFEDDCFEIMVAPNPMKPDTYFNLEWNVLGGILDNYRPDGPKKPRAPKWDAEGVSIAGRYVGTLNDDSDKDMSWTVEVAIPWKNFALAGGNLPPKAGDIWRANFNRHGGKTNPQYSQWSSGDTPTANFHTPHRFGKLLFR